MGQTIISFGQFSRAQEEEDFFRHPEMGIDVEKP
jgi:hypothetical protein